MESPTAPAAPAQPVAEQTPAPTISATRDAANKGDFSAFETAHLAQREGKPMPRVEAAAEPPVPVSTDPKAAAPAPPLSRKEREQQDINERVRKAVDAATTDLRAELARVRGTAPAPVAPPADPPAPVKGTPDYKRLMALPDAPKLADFDSVEEHAFAAAEFIEKVRHDERQTEAQQAEHQAQRDRFNRERGQQYGERLMAAREADPEFLEKIPPAIRTALPLSGLPKGERATFANVVAEVGLHSENPAGLYTHLHTNQDEALRIARLPSDQWLPALHRLDGRLSGATAAPPASTPAAAPTPAPAVPSTITAAPAPVQTVTRAGATADPKAAALKNGDFLTFDKLDLAERTRKKGAA